MDHGPQKTTLIKKLIRAFNPRWHLIKEHIKRQHNGPYVEKNKAGYTIAVICRGEQLLYTDKNGSVIIEINIPFRWIDSKSISKWDEIQDISEGERSMIIERVKDYFIAYQGLHMRTISNEIKSHE